MKNYSAFKLSIELGNDAVQTAADVARLLEYVARRLRGGVESGKVMDANGNSVGQFELTHE